MATPSRKYPVANGIVTSELVTTPGRGLLTVKAVNTAKYVLQFARKIRKKEFCLHFLC